MEKGTPIGDPENHPIQPSDIPDSGFGPYNEAFGGACALSTGAWALMRFYRGGHAGSRTWTPFEETEFCEWTQWSDPLIAALDALVEEGYLLKEEGRVRVTAELVEICFKAARRSDS